MFAHRRISYTAVNVSDKNFIISLNLEKKLKITNKIASAINEVDRDFNFNIFGTDRLNNFQMILFVLVLKNNMHVKELSIKFK